MTGEGAPGMYQHSSLGRFPRLKIWLGWHLVEFLRGPGVAYLPDGKRIERAAGPTGVVWVAPCWWPFRTKIVEPNPLEN